MYYLMKGTVNDEYGDGTFEWVLEADSVEAAKAQLDENEVLEAIREISVEERIEREEKAIFESAKRDYLYRRYSDCSIREYSKYQRQMESDPEMFYKALVEYNKAHRLMKRLNRRNGFEKITIAQFFDLVNKLIDAKTEEDFNTILRSVDN